MRKSIQWLLQAAVALSMIGLANAADKPRSVSDWQASLIRYAPGSSIQCHTDKFGQPACTVDGTTAEVNACGEDGFFGQVIAKDGATLESSAQAGKGKPLAHLQSKQFLCLAAELKHGPDPVRFFVVAMPTSRVAACKGNDSCHDKPVQWIGAKPVQTCRWNASGDFVGGCPAGWVDRDKVEDFSMGL